ncbi:sulfotransferase [Sphingomonas sp.]|uniref:sulfotransferase family protein n=1 Tax=Sphingomonas sp. TaxID=28214 RepID=UPI001B14E5D7|nr:sulfotransferase [Sphingomonas sp.]MBO9714531.1 sulfotransferase [Sphingomonas sp.]
MTSERWPDFVIIGAMKCATSTLHVQLAAQPGFWMSNPKEPNFFSDPEQWAKGLDWYKGLFAGAGAVDLCGESSTHYTKLPDLPDALPRVAEYLPDARFIYVMRHPIDRLVSHFIHGWSKRDMDGPIEDAVKRHPALVDYGRYAMQITPWIERFGQDKVLPVFFERLTAHPQAEFERICAFLGYAGAPVWRPDLRDNVSEQRMRSSPLRDAIVKNPLATFLRRTFVPQAMRDRIKSQWQMRERPELSAEARAGLETLFDPDLARLGAMLGTPLSCATFKETVRARSLEWARN